MKELQNCDARSKVNRIQIDTQKVHLSVQNSCSTQRSPKKKKITKKKVNKLEATFDHTRLLEEISPRKQFLTTKEDF